MLLFTKAGWSALPYPINFGLSSTLAFPSAYLEAAFTLAPFFLSFVMTTLTDWRRPVEIFGHFFFLMQR